MGTRNLTAVFIDGEYKIAQYGQWDGYPSGQGMTALAFLRSMDEPKFRERLKLCRWLNDADEAKLAGPAFDWKAEFPYLTRDHGAEILGLVQDRDDIPVLRNEIDFGKDGVMCEWAYVIDFDKRTFEAYKGFNHEPVAEDARFTGEPYDAGSGRKYYPVKLVDQWSLDSLPGDDEFIKALEPQDEDKEAA